ncbi:MAG: hypothetical protein WCL39_02930 [Armatimonadota bacterium]
MKKSLVSLVVISLIGFLLDTGFLPAWSQTPQMEAALVVGQALRVKPGESVGFVLRQSAIASPGSSGFQAFLEYDAGRLAYVSGGYTPSPYTVYLLSPIQAVGGKIDLAAHVNVFMGAGPIVRAADLAVLHFTAANSAGPVRLAFRTSVPLSEFGSPDGALLAELVDSPVVVVDGTGPALSGAQFDPPVALPGQVIGVSVTAIDDAGVSSVFLNGSPMTLNNGVWNGQVVASGILGSHVVGFQAVDGLGNTSTKNDAAYTTGRKVRAEARSAYESIMTNASQRFVFEFAGSVVVQDQDSGTFVLCDGSDTPLTVVLPDHGLATGRWVSTSGYLELTTQGPRLHTSTTHTKVLF